MTRPTGSGLIMADFADCLYTPERTKAELEGLEARLAAECGLALANVRRELLRLDREGKLVDSPLVADWRATYARSVDWAGVPTEVIRHTHTDQIVCPYCGHKDRDSWEFLNGEEGVEEAECGECERSFTASRHVSVFYSTVRAPEPSKEGEPAQRED